MNSTTTVSIQIRTGAPVTRQLVENVSGVSTPPRVIWVFQRRGNRFFAALEIIPPLGDCFALLETFYQIFIYFNSSGFVLQLWHYFWNLWIFLKSFSPLHSNQIAKQESIFLSPAKVQ
jgi:hypothetical protein